jgi:hypothetical protein
MNIDFGLLGSQAVQTEVEEVRQPPRHLPEYQPSSTLAEGKMSVVAHLAELTEKHKVLERKIQEELARPAGDSTQINRMKLEKLRLKDEIARLSATRH